MRRFLRRIRDLFPWTPLGLLVAGASAFALVQFAYGQMDLVLLVAGYVGVGVVALATLLTVTVAIGLRVSLGRQPQESELFRVETDRWTPTGFRLPAWNWIPLLHIRWEWEPRESARVRTERKRGGLHESVEVRERGEVAVERRIVIEDVFRLSRLAFHFRESRLTQALPALRGLTTMPVLTSLAGGEAIPHPMGVVDGDRLDLRRYEPGDPARFIHWKVFGRTRKLMVRVPERALSRARRTVAYFVAGADDEASAAAARAALETGALGREWRFRADGATADAAHVDDALVQLLRAKRVRPDGGQGLAGFVEHAEQSGPASLVLFVPPQPGPWLARVSEVVRRHRHGVRVVVAVDGTTAPASRRWGVKLLTLRTPAVGTAQRDLDAVVRQLAAAGSDVVVFERPTGRVLMRADRSRTRQLQMKAVA